MASNETVSDSATHKPADFSPPVPAHQDKILLPPPTHGVSVPVASEVAPGDVQAEGCRRSLPQGPWRSGLRADVVRLTQR